MPTVQKSKRDLVSGIFNQLFYPASTSSFQRSYPSKLEVTAAAAAAKSLQSCPTLCKPIDGVAGVLKSRRVFPVRLSLIRESHDCLPSGLCGPAL